MTAVTKFFTLSFPDHTDCQCPGNEKDTMDCNLHPCPVPTSSVTHRDFDLTHDIATSEKKEGKVVEGPTPCVQLDDCHPPIHPDPPKNNTCEWTDWCNWSPCPTTCNFGLTRRHR